MPARGSSPMRAEPSASCCCRTRPPSPPEARTSSRAGHYTADELRETHRLPDAKARDKAPHYSVVIADGVEQDAADQRGERDPERLGKSDDAVGAPAVEWVGDHRDRGLM